MSIQPLGITPPIPLLSDQRMPKQLGFLDCQLYDLFLFYTFGSCKAIILTNLLCFVSCTLL